MIEKLGGRKFLLTVAACVVFTALFAVGKLTEQGYKDMLLWVIGLFTGGNIGEHATDAISSIAQLVPSDPKQNGN